MLKDDDGARERARRRAWAPSAERVEILATLSELFASPELARDDALRAAAVTVADVLDDAVIVYLLAEDRRAMRVIAAHHRDPSTCQALTAFEGTRLRADTGFSGCVLDTEAAVLIPRVTPLEIEALQPELAPVCSAVRTTGFVLAPLASRGRILGFVAQCRTREEPVLGDDDKRFLDEVAMRLALGVASWPGPAAV